MALLDPYPVPSLSGPFDLTLGDAPGSTLPGSKSLTNRALLIAALADGTTRLTNVLFADDTRVMIDALGRLGFTLRVDEETRTVEVEGQGGTIPADHAELTLGNAGTAMRFLTAACCLGEGTYTLDGIERMRQRPIGQLVDALRHLGATIEYLGEEGYPPLRIRAAGLEGGAITLSTMLSSQYVSALIIAGPLMRKGLRITTEGPETSRPYVEMTHHLVERFTGAHAAGPEGQITLSYEPTGYRAVDLPIEPDASNASYFLAAAAIQPMSTCRIDGLGRASLQGDAAFAHTLGRMGATVQQLESQTWIKGPQRLRGIDEDLNAMPDMAQTLAVVALFAEGPTVIRDVGNLRVKETDRLAAIDTELTKLGAAVDLGPDGTDLSDGDLRITPPSGNVLVSSENGEPVSPENPVDIETYDDHRMAMSFALAGLRCPGVRIRDPRCVGKTFPAFWRYLDLMRQDEGR